MDNDLSHIKSIRDLQFEKVRVRDRLDRTEKELTRKMYEIPAELAAAGVNNFIPSFLRGKVTNAALSGGKKLINTFLVPEEKGNRLLPTASKGLSIVRGIKTALKLFRR